MTPYFDVALNKRNAGLGSVCCVRLFSCNDLISLAVRKRSLRLNVIYRSQSNVNVYVDVNVGAKNHNFSIPHILDKYDIMKVMQKLKYMQVFTSAINVECLHRNLQANLGVVGWCDGAG